MTVQEKAPGIGRGYYFIGMALLMGAFLVLLKVVVGKGSEDPVGPGSLLIAGFLGLWIWLASARIANIGFSGWWGFLCLVPVLGALVPPLCLVLPPGYRHHKKMDRAARWVGGVFLAACVILMIVRMWTQQP